MVDITHKNKTLRIAKAQAIVAVSSSETVDAIKNRTVPKGDVFAMSKAAGLLGVKKTPEMLPDCHPMPIEFTGIDYEIKGLDIYVFVTVKTIYKTGVEVEAMHAASVVALNIYDMLKPIDKGIEIKNIKLLKKRGGKSSFPVTDVSSVVACVIVCSDTISQDKAEDKSGALIKEKLIKYGIPQVKQSVVPDNIEAIQEHIRTLETQCHLIILTGGTGLSPRDVTPEAILPLLDRRIPGAEEAIRNYGQERMPYAMLSRSVVGVTNNTLILALPGSSKGAEESMDAVFPALFHSFNVIEGTRHE